MMKAFCRQWVYIFGVMSGVCAAVNIWLIAYPRMWFLQHLIPTVQVSHVTGPCLYCAWEQCK